LKHNCISSNPTGVFRLFEPLWKEALAEWIAMLSECSDWSCAWFRNFFPVLLLTSGFDRWPVDWIFLGTILEVSIKLLESIALAVSRLLLGPDSEQQPDLLPPFDPSGIVDSESVTFPRV
jgi:hypothetical protein